MAVTVKTALDEASAALKRGHAKEAIRIYELILRAKPDVVQAEFGLARAYFMAEDWAKAWAAYEVRFRLMEDPPVATRRLPDGTREPYPRWRFGPPPKRLLVLCEQGLGDTVQFVRFLPVLSARGVTVTIPVDKKLVRLLAPALPGVQVVGSEGSGRVSAVDAWTHLLSIPGLLGVGGNDLCPRMPYLLVEPDRVDRWRRRLVAPDRLNVGICWKGNPAHPSDASRSAPLAALAPLADVPGLRLISLQVTDTAREAILAVPFGDRIVEPDASFDRGADAFLDTAALMTSLDLVITVDT